MAGRNLTTGQDYVLVPGAEDGEADSYGVGDFWALRYRSTQLDDSAVATSTRAHLDSFVNGQLIDDTNVVVGTQPISPTTRHTNTGRATTSWADAHPAPLVARSPVRLGGGC
jgi:hypothetical protein